VNGEVTKIEAENEPESTPEKKVVYLDDAPMYSAREHDVKV
jgi:hypothetical protein